MMLGIVDTTVIVHLYRRQKQALDWMTPQSAQLGVTTITWFEVMIGARGRQGQDENQQLLDRFTLIYLTDADQDWAMIQFRKLRLSHGVSINDCLIAGVAYRMQIPLYTHNLKDLKTLIGPLAVKPYETS